MNQDDFRCMHDGKIIAIPNPDDIALLQGYRRCGPHKNRAILLLHGFSSSPAVFRKMLPHLEHYDAVIAPTLPGHGDCLTAFSTVKALDWIKAAEEHCATLCQEYKQVDVLGLSLGGLLACHLSQTFPLHHLFLLAPALELRLSIPVTLGIARFFHLLGFDRIRAKAGNLYKKESYEITYRQIPLNTIIEILTLVQQFKFALPNCPTDIFLGQHDEVINSEQVAARFASCNHCAIHWLANSAHVLPLDGDIKTILNYTPRT